MLLNERVVHDGIVPDYALMASLRCGQRSVPAALVEFDLVSLVEQSFEGTHSRQCFEVLKLHSSAEQVYPLGRGLFSASWVSASGS